MSDPLSHLREPSLFAPGRNCWKVSAATRSAVLVDAKAYFQALAWAMERAERSIHILAWDIDSRISLLPGHPGIGDQWSATAAQALGDFLVQLLERKPALEIRILSWDFIFFYANEREQKSEAKRRFARHPRLRFEFDRTGPALVSHHQKVIVIDDELAFCGGLDVTQRRWDTPEHGVEQPLRTDPGGDTYEPFHDVQMMVEGQVAAELGTIFRERWRQRTGEALPALPNRENPELWPRFVPPLLENHPMAIARTIPERPGSPPVRECAELFFDSLRAAKKYIYIENQYLTSQKIGDILIERLREPEPPEILILVRNHDSKWTEAISMSVLRSRLLRRIQRCDAKGKLMVLCPFASVEKDVSTNLHSKVFIADDRWLRIGSANLCGRSEGMDTECDLALEANSPEEIRAVRGMRNRLLAEHLGLGEAELERALEEEGSLLGALRRLQGKSDKTIRPCPRQTLFSLEWLSPSRSLVDPMDPRQFRRSVIRLGVFVVLAILIACYWKEIRSLVDKGTLLSAARWVRGQPLAPLGLILLFALLIALAAPLIPLALAYALVLPPLETFAYTLLGSMLGAHLTYFFALRWAKGRREGFFARLLEGDHLQQLKQLLAREGIWPLLLFRLTPLAPFWVVNFCMGAIGIRPWPYFVSSLLALLPGLLMIAYFEDQVATGESKGAWVLYAVIFVAVGWLLQKGVRNLLDRRAAHADGS